jgi:hypothetical protein
MGDLAVHQHVGHDADDFGSSSDDGVGEYTHEPYRGSAVNETYAGGGDALA